MKTTESKCNHKINNCVRNAYRTIKNGQEVYNIYFAYARPSIYKIRAWEWVKTSCKEDGGYVACITGWNTSKFTAAYFCPHYETGERCLVVHTANNVYWAFAGELD